VSSPAPVTPPTSAADVAAWMDRDAADAPLLGKLELPAAAASMFVQRLHNPGPDGEWDAAKRLGATMLAGRLYRRRNSAEGVATFTTDGAVYVQRNDPDIALLLELGPYARPVVA
jgi:hypothetical protein